MNQRAEAIRSSIPRFDLVIDGLLTALLVMAGLIWLWVWLFKTNQKLVPASERFFKTAARRWVALVVVVATAMYFLDVALWLLIAVFVGAYLLAASGSIVGMIAFPIVLIAYAVLQWILGFPEPIEPDFVRATSKENRPPNPLEKLVGKSGRTVGPLRPQGEVQVGQEIYSAMSDSRSVIDAGQQVSVVAVSNGKLIVR